MRVTDSQSQENWALNGLLTFLFWKILFPFVDCMQYFQKRKVSISSNAQFSCDHEFVTLMSSTSFLIK
jgi:hypothetical protein